jgi:histidinol-phosphate aminotransferase
MVFASAANFLLVKCTDARNVYRRLLGAGVVVRDVSHHAALAECLRISVGSELDHAALETALNLREAAA